MANLEELSDEELMAQWDQAGEELAAAKDRVTAFSLEHQRREALKAARIKARNLSPEELALLQEAGPESIESGEEFGEPGGEE